MSRKGKKKKIPQTLGQQLREKSGKGGTSKTRKQRLRSLTLFSYVFCILTLLLPVYYTLQISLCALLPVFILLSLRGSKASFTDNLGKGLEVFSGILLCPITLMVRAISDAEVLDYSSFWLPFVIVTALMTILMLWADASLKLNLKDLGSYFIGISFTIIAACYAFGLVGSANIAFETSTADAYKAQVLDKQKSGGGSQLTSYHFQLSPWGPLDVSEKVSIKKHLYESTSIGDSVNVYLYQGALGIPNYRLYSYYD